MGSYCSQMLTLVTLLFILDNSCVCFCNNSTSICREQERETLLQLRQSLFDPSDLLSSWKGKDCCRWDGVICDGVYGHVIKLQLSPQPRRDETIVLFPMEPKLLLAGEFNSSLLHLRYLNHLDLSGIDSNQKRIPEFIGSIKRLRYLNLSFANFYGTVPQQLGNLTKLEVLDLHNEDENLVVDDILWVSYLRSLKYLDMSGSMIANKRALMQVMSTLPALSHLSLSSCGLHNFHMSSDHLVNSTSLFHLQYLDLSSNLFKGPIPSTLFQNMTYLQHLDLSSNSFNSSIPMWFDKFTSLVHLDLGGNFFDSIEGGIFSFLKNNRYLKSLRLCDNQIEEEISTTQGNSLGLIKNSLESLEICFNHLKGALPNWLVHFTNLKHILLSNNFFTSPIPSVIGSLSNLETLHLFNNQLAGHIPESLGKLGALQYLDLGRNHLEGVITEIHFSNLSRLKLLNINDNNNLSFKAKPNWIPPFQLEIIMMKSCKFKTKFPLWVQTQAEATEIILTNASLFGPLPKWLANLTFSWLDLSYNQITGPLPKWLANLTFNWLDLSYNHITGPLPKWSANLTFSWLVLSYNQITGPLPEWPANWTFSQLDLSYNQITGPLPEWSANLTFFELDLSYNHIIGPLPKWSANLTFFQLDLSYNQITGPLPEWSANLTFSWLDLSYNLITGLLPKWSANLTCSGLDLSYNHITGPLPNMCINCLYLDLSHNLISGPLPTNIGIIYQVYTLHLHDNLINGTLPSSLCDMELFSLNLANNSLSRSIPNCWKGSLSFLTLSFNKLSGGIPSSLGSLPYLITLHLNGNRLNGELPQALDSCTGLVILDLGENNLSGSIPTWFDKSFRSLLILRLRGNRFVGSIPSQLCSLSKLKILDMAVNNLTGTIPHCLGNMSNMINFNQGNPFGSMAIAAIQDLIRSRDVYLDWDQEHVVETIKGRYNEYTKIVLQLVVNLDLSSNFLNGSIPEELSLLSGLHGLNLSRNHLFGNIPIGIGNMTSLESLDLSNNHLSGTIPQGISALTSLAHLNLSQNNFTGQIPKGNQIQTLDDPSIYASNPLLCGDLLRKKCIGAEAPQPPKISHPKDTHEEDKLNKALFYGVVMLGFATGFWGFFGVLQFKKDWRHAYFSFADQAADKAYVTIAVKVANLKRPNLSRSV
ncbi:hypothetical protein ACJRO7_002757 [Eucalyptus globulus]|uniref:Leucine-rich repeat-containing N-terminal plant-type domain-containing protein n=1 Tax=Eucalyptus globulus TaxID=34317 RepID=A0ABD3LVI5_EUCGL